MVALPCAVGVRFGGLDKITAVDLPLSCWDRFLDDLVLQVWLLREANHFAAFIKQVETIEIVPSKPIDSGRQLGSLQEVLQQDPFIDFSYAMLDSLRCPCGLILNLDEEKIEIYEGWQRDAHSTSRFGVEPTPAQFYPLRLAWTFQFSAILWNPITGERREPQVASGAMARVISEAIRHYLTQKLIRTRLGEEGVLVPNVRLG